LLQRSLVWGFQESKRQAKTEHAVRFTPYACLHFSNAA
jgi:hypothetical protein